MSKAALTDDQVKLATAGLLGTRASQRPPARRPVRPRRWHASWQ
jgi:hypothetical protein